MAKISSIEACRSSRVFCLGLALGSQAHLPRCVRNLRALKILKSSDIVSECLPPCNNSFADLFRNTSLRCFWQCNSRIKCKGTFPIKEQRYPIPRSQLSRNLISYVPCNVKKLLLEIGSKVTSQSWHLLQQRPTCAKYVMMI